MKKWLVVMCTATLALAGCGGDPLKSNGGSGSTVTVGSADFPENVVLADIYAGALKGAGADVKTNLRVGTRETLVKGLQDGSLTVIPEYTGNLLEYLDKKATATTTPEVNAALKKALPKGLTTLTPSPAQDSDVLVVTKQTATKNHLKTVADLKKVAPKFTLGAAGEWKGRWTAPIKKTYGIKFKKFQATDAGGPVTVKSLSEGKVDVANLFTTSSDIKANHFVELTDTKHLYPAQNVVPLASDKLNAKEKAALNKVSAALTTANLTDLVSKVSVDKQNPEDVASGFLKGAGIKAG